MHSSRFLALTFFVAARCFALPLSFEERDARHFVARLPNGAVQFRTDGMVLRDITLRFLGAASRAKLEGGGPSAPSTYLRGGLARTLRQFPKLEIHDLYPGVNAVFYGTGENLEYDLEIAAGVSLNGIRISLEGARDVRIDRAGNLSVKTASGELQQMRPRVFQRNHEIAAQYVLLASNEVGIRLGEYDRGSALTIDPVLSFVKYFGGSGTSSANAIAADSQGNIYIAGQTNAVDFPTTANSFDPKSTTALQIVSNGGKSITSRRVGTATSVGVVGGTKDGRLLYAATSDGILLSGDGGATWRETAPLPLSGSGPMISSQPLTVNAIALDPLDPATLLVATNVGIFSTDSGGEFWGLHDTGLPVSATGSVWATSVFYHPTDVLTAYATTNAPWFLAKSTDGGNTWTLLDPTYAGEPAPNLDPFPAVVATLNPNGSILYAINQNGTLLKSSDAGESWVKLAQGFFGPLAIEFDPRNSNTLYVLDQQGVHKSTDGGSTFSKLTVPDQVKQLALDSVGSIYISTFNQVSVSTDGGKTFAAVPHVANSDVNSLSTIAGKVYVGSLSPSVPFVMKLDPTASHILYSTFLGGTSFGDSISSLAVDSAGNAVVVGTTFSPDFPLTIPASKPPTSSKADGFIAKLSADGSHLIFSTAIGASNTVFITGVALDSTGAVFVTGGAASSDFPTTAHVLQPALPTVTCPRNQSNGFQTPNLGEYVFVSKLSPDGKSLEYSTFLTGSCGSYPQSVTVDSAGEAVVVGITTSPDFPVSPNSYQPAFPGPTDTPEITVFDAGFVTKLSPTADKIVAGTFLGGGYTTTANAVTLDVSGNAYITGFTQGMAKGATPGAFQTTFVDRCTPTLNIGPAPPYTGTGDAFVLKLDAALSSAAFLTYLGGACNDLGNSIALDASGDIWVSGNALSPDFPLKEPFQANGIASSRFAGFVSELNADASQLLFSSFSQAAVLALTKTAVYLAGANSSSAQVVKIDPATSPDVIIDSLKPVLAFPPVTVGPFGSGIAPGLLVQIDGSNLGPATKVMSNLDAAGKLPFAVSGTVVFFDNIPAPLISVEATSVVCFVPFEVGSTTEVTVVVNGQRSNTVLAGISLSAPQILSVTNQDGSLNSAAHPAQPGSVIALYVSGLGQTNPPGDDGLTNAAPLPVPLAPINIYVPTDMPYLQVTPQFVGAAPGLIAGISQVNIQLPKAINVTAGSITIGINSASATVYVK